MFAASVSTYKVIPLEVTDMLTINAEKANSLLKANSDLMKAVFDFGNAWLESSHKLTLHDPLAAVSVFYPDICRFEKGFVRVETEKQDDMGGTHFTSSAYGNVEITKTVHKERFYSILSSALSGKDEKEHGN